MIPNDFDIDVNRPLSCKDVDSKSIYQGLVEKILLFSKLYLLFVFMQIH